MQIGAPLPTPSYADSYKTSCVSSYYVLRGPDLIVGLLRSGFNIDEMMFVLHSPRVVDFAISKRSGPYMARYLKLSTIASLTLSVSRQQLQGWLNLGPLGTFDVPNRANRSWLVVPKLCHVLVTRPIKDLLRGLSNST